MLWTDSRQAILWQIGAGVLLLVIFFSNNAYGSEGKQVLENQCMSCHQISMPETDEQTLAKKMSRLAPPLFYAGNKYKEKWLLKWLQEPKSITPSGGGYWARYVHVTDEGDLIKNSEIKPHMKLDKKQASQVSEYLMSLKPYSHLLRNNEFKEASVPKMLGENDFRKFKGCGSCHQDEPGYGGMTGPELYSAMERLQAEYVASYIRNPEQWDPVTMMPNKQLNDASIYKLMNYLRLLGGE